MQAHSPVDSAVTSGIEKVTDREEPRDEGGWYI